MNTHTQMQSRNEPCAVCTQGLAHERVLTMSLQLLDRTREYLHREWHCETCSQSYTDDDQAADNDASLVRARADALRDISGADLRRVRELVLVTQVEFEEICGLGKKTVARWETDRRPLPSYIVAMVRLLALNPLALRELAEVLRLEQERTAQLNVLRESAEGIPISDLKTLSELEGTSPKIKELTAAVVGYKSAIVGHLDVPLRVGTSRPISMKHIEKSTSAEKRRGLSR